MKGVYLSEEGKKSIENKIAELENYTYATQNIWIEGQNSGMLKILEEIVSSATLLHVEESWDTVEFSYDSPLEDLQEKYPNGVVIKSKQ
jgi:hypothetical protein